MKQSPTPTAPAVPDDTLAAFRLDLAVFETTTSHPRPGETAAAFDARIDREIDALYVRAIALEVNRG